MLAKLTIFPSVVFCIYAKFTWRPLILNADIIRQLSPSQLMTNDDQLAGRLTPRFIQCKDTP